MQMHAVTVNRKWLNKTFKSESGEGSYFSGTTPREIAFSIVQQLNMHPAFVGKLDQLITSLFQEGAYTIVDGRLVRSDNVAQRVVVAGKRHVRHEMSRRAKRLTRQHERDLHTTWQAEALA
jgi:hypothetical protein